MSNTLLSERAIAERFAAMLPEYRTQAALVPDCTGLSLRAFHGGVWGDCFVLLQPLDLARTLDDFADHRLAYAVRYLHQELAKGRQRRDRRNVA